VRESFRCAPMPPTHAVAVAEIKWRQIRQSERLQEFEVIEGGWRGS